jgi:allantoin racemase
MKGGRGRILVINPNSSATVTAAIDAAIEPLRLPGGPEITVAGLAEGPPGIATQRDADSVVMPLARWVERDDADAFVLACFSDPGLHAVR